MKISELIKSLNELKDIYGDYPCYEFIETDRKGNGFAIEVRTPICYFKPLTSDDVDNNDEPLPMGFYF